MKRHIDSEAASNELEQYFDHIRDSSYEIFKENNIQKRIKFFSCSLVKALWSFMISVKPDIVINHLRRARSFPYKGECRFQSLFNDMQEMERLLKF